MTGAGADLIVRATEQALVARSETLKPLDEAEAAMLGQPISMLIPQVVGFKLTGELH